MTSRAGIVLTLAVLSCLIGPGGFESDLEEDPNTQPVQVCRRTLDPPRKTPHFDEGILLTQLLCALGSHFITVHILQILTFLS
jgi:hypothetical protein